MDIVSGALDYAEAKKYVLGGRFPASQIDLRRTELMHVQTLQGTMPVQKIGNSIWAEKGRCLENLQSILGLAQLPLTFVFRVDFKRQTVFV